MQVKARHNHAACHCFFTVLRVPKVAARPRIAGKSTRVSFIHDQSRSVIRKTQTSATSEDMVQTINGELSKAKTRYHDEIFQPKATE